MQEKFGQTCASSSKQFSYINIQKNANRVKYKSKFKVTVHLAYSNFNRGKTTKERKETKENAIYVCLELKSKNQHKSPFKKSKSKNQHKSPFKKSISSQSSINPLRVEFHLTYKL